MAYSACVICRRCAESKGRTGDGEGVESVDRETAGSLERRGEGWM